jgi:acetyltransferase-like isoleucine patch superfamily enzyme
MREPDPERTERVRAEIKRYMETAWMTDDERAAHFGLPAGCRMRERAKILNPERLEMGECVWIGEGAVLDASGGLSIGAHTSIGLNVMVWTHSTALANLGMRNEIGSPYRVQSSVSIGAGCFIGGPSVILPGVTIGERSIVMPMSVVSNDVPSRVILGGSAPEISATLSDRSMRALFQMSGLVPPPDL